MTLDKIILKILSVGGIAGVIAIIIAGAISFRYVMHGPEEIPQVLTYSLTTIIGFYFGVSASGGNGGTNTDQDQEPTN